LTKRRLTLRHSIHADVGSLPADWDLIAAGNIFFSTDYLRVLETSAPANMQCFFVGIWDQDGLAGIAVSQFLDLNDVDSFGDRENGIRRKIRELLFRRFTSNVLMAGNNMLTGPNTFRFKPGVPLSDGFAAIDRALGDISGLLRQKGTPPHLVIWKDFESDLSDAPIPGRNAYFRFTAQPNMVFDIRPNWKDETSYVADLNKKYRDQYKRARKKNDGVSMRQLGLDEIGALEDQIYGLYMTVARNAPFNTFWLAKNHFVSLKKHLGERFLFYGYFIGGELAGFDTLISNGQSMDTYFLGYDDSVQREKMLYLNMLYNMVAYSIRKKFSKIIFARTALEIKSSVGARPVELYGYIRHTHRLFNAFMPQLFRYFEPQTPWHRRHPFRDAEPPAASGGAAR
jgi:predicted N-acyltransferase